MFQTLKRKWHSSEIGKYVDSQGGLFSEGSFDTRLFAYLFITLIIGLVMLYSASYPNAYSKGEDPSSYFTSQLVGAVVGIVAMIFVAKLNYRLFMLPGAFIGSAVSVLMLVLVLFVGDYDEDTTIKRWLKIGSFSFQPSDIAKLALILTLAYILHIHHEKMVSKKTFKTRFRWVNNLMDIVNGVVGKPVINESIVVVIECCLVILVYAGLVLAGSHLSGAIIMVLIFAVMLYVGEIRWTWIGLFIVAALLMIPILFAAGVIKPYMIERITTFFSESPDVQGADWQTTQALYAIGSGGFFGKGLGQSVQKYNYVPEPQNDMIFSIIVEELGFIGGVGILILFALMVWRGIVIGVNCPTRYGALVAFGISFKLAIQVFLNIAVATDIIPNTGITLPFFSYGRTALMVNIVEMGILLSISRSSRIKKV